MKDRFIELEVALKRKHLYKKDLAPVIGKDSSCPVQYRFNGKIPWQLDEMYAVLDFLGIPKSQIYTYFPPDE